MMTRPEYPENYLTRCTHTGRSMTLLFRSMRLEAATIFNSLRFAYHPGDSGVLGGDKAAGSAPPPGTRTYARHQWEHAMDGVWASFHRAF